MGRHCSICRHPDRAAIDAVLARAASLSEVARTYPGTSQDALHRHRTAHLGGPKPSRLAHRPERVTPESLPADPATHEPTRQATVGQTREWRVRQVMRQLTRGTWEEAGRDALQARWGCTSVTMGHVVEEARRRVAWCGETEWAKARLTVALDEALERALNMVRDGEVKALGGIAALVQRYASLVGIGEVKADAAGEHVLRFEVVPAERPTPTLLPGAPSEPDGDPVLN